MRRDDLDQRMEELKSALRKAGVKVTPQRVEIFREVATSADHPDAETVHIGVKRRMPMVSLDTVYRTLWLLTELGLITTLGPRRESVRFDPNLALHHHFVCIRCGVAQDFESQDLDTLTIPRAVKEMGTVMNTQVHVMGICIRCQRQ